MIYPQWLKQPKGSLVLQLIKALYPQVNKYRNYHIFEELYRNLLKQARKRVGYSNLRIIDTTTEIVSKVLFSLWQCDEKRGAVRIGLEYDPNYQLPD